MKYLLVLFVLVTACTQQATEPAQQVVEEAQQEIVEAIQPEPKVIVAFGDSLTEGYGVGMDETYPARLEQLLRERGYDVTVINEGVSGEESSEALRRIDDVLAHNPDIVILETGVNDILRGVPANETRANIASIIEQLQKEDVTVILAGMEAFGNFQGYSFEVRTMYPGIAKEYEVELIPFFLAGVAGNPQLNLPDYVHPNAQGYAIIAEQNVLPVVEAHLN